MLAPEQHKMIEAALAAQGFFRFLGTEIVEVDAGVCALALSRRPELLQQNGYFHGGVIAYLVDNASAAAAATCLRAGQTVLTAEYKVNFLSPARGERLVCRAEVLRAGRRMTVVEARVSSDSPASPRENAGEAVAVALTTMAVVADPASGK